MEASDPRVDVLVHAGDGIQHLEDVGDILDTTAGFQVVSHDDKHLMTIPGMAEVKVDHRPGVTTYIFYPTQEGPTDADN